MITSRSCSYYAYLDLQLLLLAPVVDVFLPQLQVQLQPLVQQRQPVVVLLDAHKLVLPLLQPLYLRVSRDQLRFLAPFISISNSKVLITQFEHVVRELLPADDLLLAVLPVEQVRVLHVDLLLFVPQQK